ncbi:P-loop containing nucleoside triphosphate hydrolase protein, partial [Gilbertella persicaria]|uniref:P-loop containing nucleoside triphosphate hydrolase protein n=1 Tax=Gilbertella persicaria TaxID=101096 RepID=UPI0022200D2B
MAPLEVIGGGFGRTGTDSLRNALNMLGYNTHHMKMMFEDPEQDPDDFTNAYHNRDQADWDKIFKNYDAAVDWPSVTFYKELLKKYPNAKVVLTVRSADSWYKSVKNTIFKGAMALSAGGAVPPGAPNKNFTDMFKSVCMEGLLMDPERFADEEKVKQLFLDHNEEVKRTVPADQLLIMELGEGWDRLCAFLGKEIPKEPYPNSNSTAEFQKHFSESFE